MFDIAQRLIAQCRLWWQQAQRGELQGELDLLWPSELLHWERTMEELRPARARMFWQAGQVRQGRQAGMLPSAAVDSGAQQYISVY